jgi:hypothetical protein
MVPGSLVLSPGGLTNVETVKVGDWLTSPSGTQGRVSAAELTVTDSLYVVQIGFRKTKLIGDDALLTADGWRTIIQIIKAGGGGLAVTGCGGEPISQVVGGVEISPKLGLRMIEGITHEPGAFEIIRLHCDPPMGLQIDGVLVLPATVDRDSFRAFGAVAKATSVRPRKGLFSGQK